MSAQHTKGRLYSLPGDPSVLHAEQGTRGRRVCCTMSFGDKDENNANARRLAACWNACDGISTKNLEDNLPVKELATRYNTVLAQRDALLVALRQAAMWLPVIVEMCGLDAEECEVTFSEFEDGKPVETISIASSIALAIEVIAKAGNSA